jgi:hypothetical protein
LNHRNLALGLGMVFGALIMISALYTLVTVTFAEVNPAAVVAAIGVAVAGIVWFKKTVKNV